jgi:hypothetical protein
VIFGAETGKLSLLIKPFLLHGNRRVTPGGRLLQDEVSSKSRKFEVPRTAGRLARHIMAAPSVSLSTPYTVFPLSLPLQQTRAKDKKGSSHRACYTSQVESRKRKRVAEIATAVDGEGVNIYDVCLTLCFCL